MRFSNGSRVVAVTAQRKIGCFNRFLSLTFPLEQLGSFQQDGAIARSAIQNLAENSF